MRAADQRITFEGPGKRWRRAGWLISLGIAAAWLLLGAPRAEAGGYQVVECTGNYPEAAGAPEAIFSAVGTNQGGHQAFTSEYNCPFKTWDGQGGLKVLPQHQDYTNSYGSWAAWEIRAPAGTFFRSASWGYVLCNANWNNSIHTSWGAYTATYSYLGGNPAATSQYSPISPAPGGCNLGVMQVSAPSDRAGLLIECRPNPPGDCLSHQGVSATMGSFTFVVDDPNPPRVSSLYGSLLAGGPRAGVQGLALAASDQGAGIREARVWVNGSEIARPQASCSLIAGGNAGARLVPCPGSFSHALNTDTARGPWHEGQNTVTVCVYEFATENAPGSDCTSRTVVIDNSCVDSQGAVGQGVQLSGGLARTAQDAPAPQLQVRSDESATIRGSLSGSGGPVAAANVCLYEQIDAPAEVRQLVQVTKTRSDGSFALQVPAGPSRAYDLVYRNDSSVLERKALHLESVAVPTLKVSKKKLRNRKAVGFYGEIPGPRAGHRTVGLQALAGKKCRKKKPNRGKGAKKRAKKPKGPRCRLKWRTFKVLTTQGDGGYAGKYRFTQTRGKARYRFRAIIAKQNGYPYAPGVSSELSVRVRGKKLRRR
jgi:hypothetical protein